MKRTGDTVKISRRWTIASNLLFLLAYVSSLAQAAQTPTANPRQQQITPARPTVVQLPAVKTVTILNKAAIQTGGIVKASATGGHEVTVRIELTGPAPCIEHCGSVTPTGQKSGWMPVMLSSNNPGATNLPGMAISTGQVSGEFRFVPSPVNLSTPVVISAFTQGSAPQSAALTILPPAMTTFVVDQVNVLGGTTVRGAINFTGPPAAAGAVKVQLSTTNSAAVKIPATVMLEPNKTLATFEIPTLGVDQDTTVHVVATYQDKISPAAITIRAAALKDLAYSVSCGSPGQAKVLVVATLTGPAGPKGAAIALTSSDPARFPLPPTLTVPAQQIEGYVSTELKQLPSPITVTGAYQGKSAKTTFGPYAKPDLFIKSVSFYDRYGNAIDVAKDSEPFKMRVAVFNGTDDNHFVCLFPPPSSLYVSYLSATGSGTSSGRSFEVTVGSNGGSIDIDLPGLQPGSFYEITLTADYRKQVDERNENNNTEKVKINGPVP